MRAAVLVALAGCSFAPLTTTQIIDTSFDGELDGGSTASRGAIEPDTYVVGGLRARAYRSTGVTINTTGQDLPTLFPDVPIGEVYGLFPTDWGDQWPKGLNIGATDYFSVLFDGEIYLPAGTSTYALAADDAGFFEITVDGTVTSIHADFNTNGSTQIVTQQPGWYPIRGAFSESIGSARMVLLDMTSGTADLVRARRLRAKTTDARGLMAYLYALEETEYLTGIWFDKGPIDHDTLVPGPSDYGYANTWSMHYAGQLLIDHEGDYTVEVLHGADPDDVTRTFVDGELVAADWFGLKQPAMTTHLTAGWHAFAADFGQNIGGAQVHLRITEAGGEAKPVGADHLRPAIARNQPVSLYTPAQTFTWADGGSATATFTTAPDDGRVIDTLDFMYILVGGVRAGLSATLANGDQIDPVTIRDTANETNIANTPYDYDVLRSAFVGMPMQAAWTFTVNDGKVDAVGGGIQQAVVIATTHGGTIVQPFSPTVVYTSDVKDTPGATLLSFVVDAALDGATMKLEVRVAGDRGNLATAPWQSIEVGAGVVGGDVAQYRVTLTGDGWQFPSVSRVELDFYE
ncbi:MAG: hypothetical protein QM831_31370 [Kofleriaceae bacterium]